MLVRTFQVQVGARAGLVTHRVRATQHVPVSGARIEPHVEGVADLVVQRRFVAQQLGGVQFEPGFDAFLLDTLGHDFHQLDGARVQFTAFLVQEERDRNAPVTLAGDAPVRTVGDHRVQARLAPRRDERGVFDGFERTYTQGVAAGRLFVHADKPLRRSAVDQRVL